MSCYINNNRTEIPQPPFRYEDDEKPNWIRRRLRSLCYLFEKTTEKFVQMFNFSNKKFVIVVDSFRSILGGYKATPRSITQSQTLNTSNVPNNINDNQNVFDEQTVRETETLEHERSSSIQKPMSAWSGSDRKNFRNPSTPTDLRRSSNETAGK